MRLPARQETGTFCAMQPLPDNVRSDNICGTRVSVAMTADHLCEASLDPSVFVSSSDDLALLDEPAMLEQLDPTMHRC